MASKKWCSYMKCVSVFTHFITEDLKTFQNESEDVFLYFRHRNLEAMLAAVKSSIDVLRRRIVTKLVLITRS